VESLVDFLEAFVIMFVDFCLFAAIFILIVFVVHLIIRDNRRF